MTIPRMALAVATAFMILGMVPTGAEASCARWGETGYHYYRSCWGPSFLYPHHRNCDLHSGLCLYH